MRSYAAFLSSTFVDLQAHRTAVAAALERLGLRVVWMERFGARPDEPKTACLGEVVGSDLFIGLYAHRYGSIPAGGDLSITEEEFEQARVHNKPLFCFFVQNNYPWDPELIESEPGRSKLAAFRDRVKNQVVRDVFTTPEDLAVKVTSAVGSYLKDRAYPPDGDQVTIERVTDATSRTLLAALNLFTRRIPERERFPTEDIVRWLREDHEKSKATGCGLRHYFLVARSQSRVCGFSLMHYYRSHRLIFVAYMATEKEVALARGTIAARLLQGLAQLMETDEQLRSCRGFLLEVEDPRHALSKKDRVRQEARIGLFCTLAQARGFTLRALGVEYHQPLLQVPEPADRGKEHPMLLMYAAKNIDNSISRSEVEKLFEFVYRELYPSGFSLVAEENERYKAYLDEFYAEQISGLPDQVRLLNSLDIRKRNTV